MARRSAVTFKSKGGRVSFMKGPGKIRVGDVVEKNGRRLIVIGVGYRYRDRRYLQVINEPVGWEMVRPASVKKVRDRDG